jgi:PadR family transcriptional regulator, regulatory protein PadR
VPDILASIFLEEHRVMALLKGTLDVLVLKTLSWGPMHGFEITRWLENRSGGRLDVTDAALLQALHRLEARGLLTAEWGVTKNERRARYYKLTTAGRAELRAESAALIEQFQAMTSVLTARSA